MKIVIKVDLGYPLKRQANDSCGSQAAGYFREMGAMMGTDWTDLEARLNFSGIGDFVDTEIRPKLVSLSEMATTFDQEAIKKQLGRSFSIAFFGFGIAFFVIAVGLPDHWWMVVLKFILFPILFLGSLLLAAWLERKRLGLLILQTSQNFITRSQVLDAVSQRLGLVYVPSPGGAPQSLKLLTKTGLFNSLTGPIVDLLDRHGGMDDAVEAAIDSGLLAPDTVVLGSEEQRARYYRQTALGHSFEDGFEGQRHGVGFSAFEWIETVEDADDKYHLILVLNAPHRLTGTTQLRSRKTPWPKRLDDIDFQPVQLVPESFNEKFRLRSTDQVEARTIFNPAVVERVLELAHGETFRAVAREKHLVLDIVGDNRFNMVDLHTGVWTDDQIRRSLTDIAEMLEFVDAVSHAFMVSD